MDSYKKLVSIIIPNWNGLNLLKVCLPSINKQTFKNFEVIIVDNGSADKSVDFVQENFPQFKCIKLKKNFGFAKAVNVGIKESNSRFVFLLNNDTELDKNCLRNLINVFKKNPKIAMVAAKILNFYDRKLIDSAGDFMDVSGHLYTKGFGEVDSKKYNISRSTFLVTGGGSIFKKEVFKKVGFFDEDYFMYMEDADLSFRAQLAGFKAWYEPKAVIYHMRMASSSKNMKLTEYLNFRNMMVTLIKNFPIKLIFRDFNWLKILLVNINTIRYFVMKGMIYQAIAAEAYIIFNLPNILGKRFIIQTNKRVSDDYIINNIVDKKLRFNRV